MYEPPPGEAYQIPVSSIHYDRRRLFHSGPVEEVLNSVDGTSITVDDPGDTATNVSSGYNIQDPPGETPSSALDEVWTDRSELIFDVDDRPPFSIAFVYALQVRPLDDESR